MTTKSTPAPATNSMNDSITVNIYDNAYQLRGTDPVHIQKIADIVDSKMRAVAQRGTTVDSLRVAVLAALNIADELLTTQARIDTRAADQALQSRADNLSHLLDSVLEPQRRAG